MTVHRINNSPFPMYKIIRSVVLAASVCMLVAAVGVAGVSAQTRVSKTATFFIFKITAAQPQPVVSLVETKAVPGEYKVPAVSDKHEHDAGLLVVTVSDASGNVVYETHCNNPIDQSLEYIDESGRIARSRVTAPEGTFELRVPMDVTGHTISVYQVDDSNRLSLLFTR
jgi:hypothetical protein